MIGVDRIFDFKFSCIELLVLILLSLICTFSVFCNCTKLQKLEDLLRERDSSTKVSTCVRIKGKNYIVDNLFNADLSFLSCDVTYNLQDTDNRVEDLEREKGILEESCQKSFKAIQGFTVKLQSKELEVNMYQFVKVLIRVNNISNDESIDIPILFLPFLHIQE